MMENEYATEIARQFEMEPDTKSGELMNSSQTVALVQDENDLPVRLKMLRKRPEEVERIEREDDILQFKYDGVDGFFQAKYLDPVAEIVEMDVKEAFFSSPEQMRTAKCPVPGKGEWNVLIAPYQYK